MEWISVEKRLPDFDIPVLVCYPMLNEDNLEVGIGCLDSINEGAGYKNLTWEASNGFIEPKEFSGNVTHWAELPEPPK